MTNGNLRADVKLERQAGDDKSGTRLALTVADVEQIRLGTNWKRPAPDRQGCRD